MPRHLKALTILAILLTALPFLTTCGEEEEEAEAEADGIPNGPGEPTIEFTYVPPYGSSENLHGNVKHVKTADCMVAVYIRVNEGWWTKPYWSDPLTPRCDAARERFENDGRWECDITTGGIDEQATEIVAYLVPKGYDPPSMSGQYELPPELEEVSLAKAYVEREPSAEIIQ